ncbi:PREDICTED: keratin-associated protein 29-1 [Condylura cristata]|uniref:keratin-associated protein 29-1 n=1 Tax=Condylura cristata TaxID=143302 RepID=UPI000643752C|nr:PREDICTED: keratin-associated protein 29-1 [Condylura cristata]
MADSCCPRDAAASATVPTMSIYSNAGRFRRGLSLPSSCRSRTWQLVTCEKNCQASSHAPSDCEAASCPPTCLPATSCVGFVCQPICSCTACYEPGAGQSSCPVGSSQLSCSEATSCCEASSCQQNSCQEPACVPGSRQGACDQQDCPNSRYEVPPCPERSCPTAACGVSQAGLGQPVSGEGQPCPPTYYQPICYILKTCQSVVSMPAPCQPSMYVFSPCNPTCYMSSPCQALHCHSVPSMSFICQPAVSCQPAASCQPPCSAKNPCQLASEDPGSSERLQIPSRPADLLRDRLRQTPWWWRQWLATSSSKSLQEQPLFARFLPTWSQVQRLSGYSSLMEDGRLPGLHASSRACDIRGAPLASTSGQALRRLLAHLSLSLAASTPAADKALVQGR